MITSSDQPLNVENITTKISKTPTKSTDKSVGDNNKNTTSAIKSSSSSSATKKSAYPSNHPTSTSQASIAKSGEKKKVSTPSSTSKKRKIEELSKTVKEIEKNVIKLKKNKTRLENLVKAAEAKKLELAKAIAIPPPTYFFKVPQDAFFDFLVTWQYLRIFRDKLCLPALTLDAYADLIVFTRRDSVGIVEIFSALLKLLLRDRKCVSRILSSIPKQLCIEHRNSVFNHSLYSGNNATSGSNNSNGTSTIKRSHNNNNSIMDLTSSSSSLPSSTILQLPADQERLCTHLLQWCDWSIPDSAFDCMYNGLGPLPRHLNVSTVNGITWQAVLRCVLLRLESVKTMRKHFTLRYASLPVTSSSSCSSISSMSMKSVTNTTTSNNSGGGGVSYRRTNKLNKDALLSITADSTQRLALLHEAAATLEKSELYSLSPKHKLAILATLVEACSDTTEISQHMETNAEELASHQQEINKTIREAKLHQKAATDARRQEAVDTCRELNRVTATELLAQKQAMLEAAAAAKLEAKSSKQRNSNQCNNNNKLFEMDVEGGDTTTNTITTMDNNSGICTEKLPPSKSQISRNTSRTDINGSSTSTVIMSTKIFGKGSSGKQPSYEPTSGQIVAMIEDLVMLSTFDIHGIATQPPSLIAPIDMIIYDDDDDDHFFSSSSTSSSSSTRLKKLHKKDRNYLATKAWDAYEEKVTLRKEAIELLQEAITNGQEKELRNAIKKGIKAGLKWTDENGRILCTEKMKEAYKLLTVFDNRAKEDKESVNNEKAFEQYFTRVDPLGKDRNGSIYWKFPGCDDKLYVELFEPQLPPPQFVVALDPTVTMTMYTTSSSSSSSSSGETAITNDISLSSSSSATTSSSTASTGDKTSIVNQWFEESSALKTLYEVRNTRYSSQWKSYDCLNTMWVFCEHLDVTVEVEKNLKAAIMARYDIIQPDMVFLTEGSEYIGRCVTRSFGKKNVIGTIVGYLPQEGDDAALWHVRHVDGDAEDLELFEVLATLVEAELAAAAEPKELTKKDNESNNGKVIKNSSSTNTDHVLESKQRDDDDDDDDDDSDEGDSRHHKIAMKFTKQIDTACANNFSVSRNTDAISVYSNNDDDNIMAIDSKESHQHEAALVNNKINRHLESKEQKEDPQDGYQQDDDEEGDDEPAIITHFPSYKRNAPRLLDSSIGLSGLQQELLNTQRHMVDGLRRHGSDSKTQRRIWEENVRNSYSLNEMRKALLDLEKIIHDTQVEEDVKDADEYARNRTFKIRRLKQEGWIFDKNINSSNGIMSSGSDNNCGRSSSDKNGGSSMEKADLNIGSDETIDTKTIAAVMNNRGTGHNDDTKNRFDDNHLFCNTSSYANIQNIPITVASSTTTFISDSIGSITTGGNVDSNNSGRSYSSSCVVTLPFVYDPATGPLDAIGHRARRFFSGYGKSDGTIVAYLPPDKNDGLALWHLEHDDGDEEDLEDSNVLKALRLHFFDATEDDPSSDDDEDDDDNDEDSDEEDNDEETANADAVMQAEGKEYNKNKKKKKNGGGQSASSFRLWPTEGVRIRWIQCLERSATVGEVSLNLFALRRFAHRYGIVDQLSVEMASIGERPRRRNELNGLLQYHHHSRSTTTKDIAHGNNEECSLNYSRKWKSSRRRSSYFYS